MWLFKYKSTVLYKQVILKWKMRIFPWKRVNTLHSDVFSIFLGYRILRNNLVFSKCTFCHEKNHSREIVSHIPRQLYNHNIKTWRIIILLKKLKARGKQTAPYYNVGILALEGSVEPCAAYWWRSACANHILDTQRENVGLCSRLYNLSDARFSLTLEKTSWLIKFKMQYRGLAGEEEWCTDWKSRMYEIKCHSFLWTLTDGIRFAILRTDIKGAKLSIKLSSGHFIIYNDAIFRVIAQGGITSIW